MPYVHVHDLDIKNKDGDGLKAQVKIKVNKENDKPISGVVVSGTWSGGSTNSVSCTTDSKGKCKITQRTEADSLTFTVDDISGGVVYVPDANHDRDRDSDGTSITINKNDHDDD